jgi:hypothetical protein
MTSPTIPSSKNSITSSSPTPSLPRSVITAIETVLSSLDKTKEETINIVENNPTSTMESVARDLALAVAIAGSYLVLKRAKGEDVNDSPVLIDFERSRRALERVSATQQQSSSTKSKSNSSSASIPEPTLMNDNMELVHHTNNEEQQQSEKKKKKRKREHVTDDNNITNVEKIQPSEEQQHELTEDITNEDQSTTKHHHKKHKKSKR